jgi:hypothetical protein
MNRKILSKIIAAGILAIIMGCVLHIVQQNNIQMGREAFLAKEAARYDREFHLSAHPDITRISAIIVSLFLCGILFAAYELVAFAVLKILEKINADPV